MAEQVELIPNRYIKNGNVAVLVSPGYGAGWSTWADDRYKEFLTTDSTLVQMALDGETSIKVEEYFQKVFGKDACLYTGGWCHITVKWIPVGTQFIIEEYDGSESLRTNPNTAWITA